MNYSLLKHSSVVVAGVAGLAGAAGAFVGEPLLVLVGASTTVLAGLASHFFKEAEERKRTKAKEARGASSEIAMPAPPNVSETHDEIDDAVKHIAQGRPDLTVDGLEKIKKRGWDRLTARERYRVVANLGNAKLAQQKPVEAGRKYIRTVEYQPLDEEARCYEALGYLFLGDFGRARELALRICGEHPGLGRAHMIRIRTEPDETPLDDVLESVATAVRSHPEVALALYERATTQNRLSDAEGFIRATDLDEWPALPLALGTVILQQELTRLRMSLKGPILTSPERLTQATMFLTQALEKLAADDPETFKAYLNRGTCRRLLGNLSQAREDFRKACDLAPSDELASLALARTAYDENKVEEAIGILREYLQRHAAVESEILLAFLLLERNLPEDFNEAENRLVQVIRKLDELEVNNQKAEVIEVLTDIYFKTERGEEALDLVRGPSGQALTTAAQKAIEGSVLLRLKQREEALSAARAARRTLGDSQNASCVKRVAILLEKLEQYSEAFELWRGIIPPEFIAPETLHLLRCAKEASEASYIMDFCGKLRKNGHYDQHALGYEVETLLMYSEYSRAREALLDYLKAKPDDKVVRLNLSAIAIQQDWNDLVETDPTRLPTVNELTKVEVGERVVDVLRFGPEPLYALDYAYALYRRFPDEAAANRALIIALLLPGRQALEIPKPEIVAEGVAVCYKEIDNDEKLWLVIEDESPSLTRHEYSASHGLVQSLLGKGVGDHFQFPGSRIRELKGTIIELRDKRVYRANELMEDWTTRFPDKFFLESIPVGETPTPESYSEILKVVETTAEQGDKLDEMYSDGKIPVSTLAHLAKKSVFETVRYLALQKHLVIRCCGGSRSELQEAERQLDQAETVVMDPTAIATLVLLEEIQVIRQLPFRCMVTEGTLQEIRQVISETQLTPQTAGYLSARGGRLTMQEINQQAAAEYIQRLKLIIAELEEECEVLGGGDLAYLNVKQREQLLEYVGRASVEAYAAAYKRNALLWSDDRLLQGLASEVLPTARVWSQAVFVWGNQREVLERQRRSRATARLLTFGYVFTGLNALTVVDTCEVAHWDATEPHLSSVLQDFGNPSWDYPTAFKMTAESIMRIWREAPTEEHARAVTAVLLANLADRQDYPRIVKTIKTNVDSLLGLAAARAPALHDVLETLLRTGVTPL